MSAARPHPALADFLDRYSRLFILTGAGCSTDSGIPDYRDADGQWKRSPPMTLQTFMSGVPARARYWARSMIGWRQFGSVMPNAAHRALARLEEIGRVRLLVTQNVDGLHEAAGSRDVVDLHGRLDQVRCMENEHRLPRAVMQEMLMRANPAWTELDAKVAPDGDADLDGHDFSQFHVPACPHCGGVLKPDVVFFGEAVPPERGEKIRQALAESDAMLVVGSSLMVHSGFRHARAAAAAGLPVAAINLGRTRADDFLSLKISEPCAQALSFVLEQGMPYSAAP